MFILPDLEKVVFFDTILIFTLTVFLLSTKKFDYYDCLTHFYNKRLLHIQKINGESWKYLKQPQNNN